MQREYVLRFKADKKGQNTEEKAMKKRMVPVLVAIGLIILIVAVGTGTGMMEKYSYSNEWADLYEYFGVTKEGEAAIVFENEIYPEKARVKEGVYYLPLPFVKEKLNDRFYYDSNENLLIYTTPTDSVTAAEGESRFTENGQPSAAGEVLTFSEGGILYVASDYVQKFTNLTVRLAEAPSRIEVCNTWGERRVANAAKETRIRVRGGVKSEILEEVDAGEELTILEQMENWSKVKSADMVIGYVENKRIGEIQTVEEEPVQDVQQPEYTSLTRDHKINMVWDLVTNADSNAHAVQYLQSTKGINVISPTWFSLSDEQGGISSLADAGYVNDMHQRGLEVWAMFDNTTNKEVDSKEMLSYTSRRRNVIEHLLGEVKAKGIDGINLDFEQVPQDAGEDYVQFIRELSVACRLNGIVFSVDNYVPTEYTAHYNRKEQGIFADYVVIMGYDEHWLGSQDPGSVASIRYVEKGIADTTAVVPKEKVMNALPFYTILWGSGQEVTSRALGMNAAKELLAGKGVNAQWDEETCQNYASYKEDGVTYQIWLEDEQSIETKCNVMKTFGIGGVAGWRLGLENSSVWDKIEAFMQE